MLLKEAAKKREAHDFAGAISLCLQLENLKQGRLLLTELYLETENYPLAMQVARQLQTDYPDDADVLTQRANVFAAMGQTGLALDGYEQALQRCDTSNTTALNTIRNNKAKALTDEAAYSEALDIYNVIIRSQPEFVFAYTGKAVVYYRQQEFAEALRLLKEAEHIDPGHVLIYELRSQVLAMEQQYAEALPAAEKALALAPHKAENHFRYGIILHHLGKSAAACAALQQSHTMGYPLAAKAIAVYCS